MDALIDPCMREIAPARSETHKHAQFKVVMIPLSTFSQVILERPEILEGMTWLLEAQSFVSSQNHVDLLLVMGEVQVPPLHVAELHFDPYWKPFCTNVGGAAFLRRDVACLHY